MIIASSLGTVFEWYGLLSLRCAGDHLARQYSTARSTAVRPFCLRCWRLRQGFLVRPFGDLAVWPPGRRSGANTLFGHHPHRMGWATFAVGLLPSLRQYWRNCAVVLIGCACCRTCLGVNTGLQCTSPSTLPQGRRGTYTAWIQTTAMMALLVVGTPVLGGSRLCGLGLAYSVSGVHRAAGHFRCGSGWRWRKHRPSAHEGARARIAPR